MVPFYSKAFAVRILALSLGFARHVVAGRGLWAVAPICWFRALRGVVGRFRLLSSPTLI